VPDAPAALDSPPSRSGEAAPEKRILARHRFEYFALRVAVGLLRALPLETGVWLAGQIGRAIGPRLKRHRRAESQLSQLIPAYDEATRRRLLEAMWRHLGETFAESLQLDRLHAAPDRIVLNAQCRVILQRTIAEGGVIACAHLGNWEAAAIPLTAAGARHAGVYRKLANPLSEAYFLRLRSPFYPSGLFPKGQSAARALMRQSREGGSVGLMADLRERDGVRVPFFGRLAPTTPMPAMLARQFQRPLFAVALIRTARCRFEMQAVEIEVPRSGDRAEDMRVAMSGVQAAFEVWIRRWPEQWMWAHRRFET
jgi:KDO2-lipid IV(A) lauroyltransferase